MAMFQNLSFTKRWILSKYSRFMFNNCKEQSKWETLDNSQCGESINFMITPMNFLIINCENEIKEYINLFNSNESIKALYKGNSLLIIQKMPDFLRKFRVQFLDFNDKSGQENCLDCVKHLREYFEVAQFEDNDQQSAATSFQSQQSTSFSNMPRTQQQHLNKSTFSREAKSSPKRFKSAPPRQSAAATRAASSNDDKQSKSTVADLISNLFNRNEAKLPLLIQKQHQAQQHQPFEMENEIVPVVNDEDNRYLDEFILSCLIDPSYSQFVKNVEERLVHLVKNETNNLSYK